MKKKSTSYLQQFWSYVQKTDQNYPKIQEIWQHADIPIFPPGARTYQNHFLSPIHLLNKIQQFSFALNAPFSMPININNSRQHSPDRQYTDFFSNVLYCKNLLFNIHLKAHFFGCSSIFTYIFQNSVQLIWSS